MVIIIGVVLGGFWRRAGSRWESALMGKAGVYRDDHLPTVLSALKQTNATWHCVQVTLKDESTLELNADDLPHRPMPTNSILVNEDGILIYVTGRFLSDSSWKKSDWGDER